MSERGGGLGAFLLGLAVGAVAGVLFAPEAGEGTRRKLSRKMQDLREIAEEKADEVRGLLEARDEIAELDDPGDGSDDADDEPASARAELERRLAAARRRRKGGKRPAAQVDEEDEPVA